MFSRILRFRLNVYQHKVNEFAVLATFYHKLSCVELFQLFSINFDFSGKLNNVEPITMNLSLSDVTFIGTDEVTIDFDSFYVQGKNIRYVQIPDEIDMLATIKR